MLFCVKNCATCLIVKSTLHSIFNMCIHMIQSVELQPNGRKDGGKQGEEDRMAGGEEWKRCRAPEWLKAERGNAGGRAGGQKEQKANMAKRQRNAVGRSAQGDGMCEDQKAKCYKGRGQAGCYGGLSIVRETRARQQTIESTWRRSECVTRGGAAKQTKANGVGGMAKTSP